MKEPLNKIFTFLLWLLKQVLLFLVRIIGIVLASLCILVGNMLVHMGSGLEAIILKKLSKK